MADIADDMLDGTLCEACGEFLENDIAPGYPMYCSVECAKSRGVSDKDLPYCVVGYGANDEGEA